MKTLARLSLLLTTLYATPWLWSYLRPLRLYTSTNPLVYYSASDGRIIRFKRDVVSFPYEFQTLGLPLIALAPIAIWLLRPRRKPTRGFPIVPNQSETPTPTAHIPQPTAPQPPNV